MTTAIPAALFAIVVAVASASAQGGGATEAPSTRDGAADERKCTISVEKVARSVCKSRNQRVETCIGGGKPEKVTPLNCV